LALRSVPDRGTVFTLELPVGRPAPPARAIPPASEPLGPTLDGKLIVVIEDEPAVRTAMEILLEGWGAQVASFDGVAASTEWARERGEGGRCPHLLIVDYRLGDGHNGVEAIHALRAACGRAVPAVIVTGSMITGPDAAADRHDYHLMIKPVVPGKLRAMIGFKLGLG
jgi:two-component system, sensor histidine kinase